MDDLSKTVKESNPKDAIGSLKAPFSTIPANVMGEVGLALLEGGIKYGRHNYRAIGVRCSVYYDATMRHLTAFWEGEDIDPLSQLSHVTKAISSLVVLRDAMINNNWEDDRPPKVNFDWIEELNKKAEQLIKNNPNPKEPFTNKNT